MFDAAAMSSHVYVKFKSATSYDTIHFDGFFISVADLKKSIAEHQKLGAGAGDLDLVLQDAQTAEGG